MKPACVFIMFCLTELNSVYSQMSAGSDPTHEQTDTPEMHVIELLIVVDNSVYVRWMQEANSVQGTGDTVVKLGYHYAYIVAGVNERFSTITNETFAIRVDVIGVHIIKEEESILWTIGQRSATSLDAGDTLASFRRWILSTPGLPAHDHAILFTWYDLTKDGSNSIAGMAYVATMCSSSSYSVVEDNFSSLVHSVTTHELGHSLGLQHDGSGNECTSDGEGRRYIMSATSRLNREAGLNRNSWRFSDCSLRYVSDYIAKLNRHNKNCMLTSDLEGSEVTEATAWSTNINNVTLNLEPDDQCRQIQGRHSYFCRNLYMADYSDICGVLYCSETATSCNLRLPLDGTYCGHNMVCKAGQCIESQSTTDSPGNSCIYGDQPDMFLEHGSNCSSTISTNPRLCYEENISRQCCRSCAAVVTGVEGCMYGDKSDSCASVFRVSCVVPSGDCCETCEGFGTKLADLIIPIAGGIISIGVIVVVLARKHCRQRKLAKAAARSRGRSHHVTAQRKIAKKNLPKSNAIRETDQLSRQASQSSSIFLSHDPYYPMNGQNHLVTSSQSPSTYRSLDQLYYPMGDERDRVTMTTQSGNQSQLQWKSLEKIFFPLRGQSSQISYTNPAYSEDRDSNYHSQETLKIR